MRVGGKGRIWKGERFQHVILGIRFAEELGWVAHSNNCEGTAKENGVGVDLGGKRKKKGVCGEGGREEFELLGS